MPEIGRSRIGGGTGTITFGTTTGTGTVTATTKTTAKSALTAVTAIVGRNIGVGSGLFRGSNGRETVTLDFKTLLAGDGILFEDSADSLRLSAVFSGSLEDSGVVAGTYVAPTLVISSKGIITSAGASNIIAGVQTMPGSGVPVAALAGNMLNVYRVRAEIGSGIITATSSGDIVIGLNGVVRGATAQTGITVSGSSTLAIGLATSGVTAGTYSAPLVSVDQFGRITSISSGPVSMWVQSVDMTVGPGLSVTGGPITTTGTFNISLAASGVTAGTYSNPLVSVDATGRVVAISNGTGGVASVVVAAGSGISVSGGPITSTGTITVGLAAVGPAVATYNLATVAIDANGRVVSGANGSAIGNGITALSLSGSEFGFTNNGLTGAGTIGISLSNSGVTAGTYSFATMTVDTKGRVIFAASGSIPTQAIALNGDIAASGSVGGTLVSTLANVGTAGTYNSVITDAKGRVVSGGNVAYLVANQSISVSGDATGNGATSIALTLAASGVTAGTYSLATMTVDAKGRVTFAQSGSVPGLSDVGTAGTYNQVVTDAQGRVTSGSLVNYLTTTTGPAVATYDFASVQVDSNGRIVAGSSGAPLIRSVTSLGTAMPTSVFANGTLFVYEIQAGTGIGIAPSSPPGLMEISLNTLGVQGTYTQVIVDDTGRVTAGTLANAVTSVAAVGGSGISVSGGPITSDGTFSISLASVGPAIATYNLATIQLDADGRVVAASNGSAAGNGITALTLTGTEFSFTNNGLTTAGTIGITLANSGVTAGTYTKLTVNAKGIVTAGAALTSGDVTSALGYTPMASTGTASAATTAATAGALSASRTFAASGDATGSVSSDLSSGYTMALTLASVGTAGTYNSVIADAKGRVISGGNVAYLVNNQPITVSGDAAGSGATAIALSLSTTGVVAGSYNFASFVVDTKGRLSFAGSGSPVTSVAAVGGSGISVSGGPITSAGTFSISLAAVGPAVATYNLATIQLDANGRVVAASNGSASGSGLTALSLSGSDFSFTNNDLTSAGTIGIALVNSGVTAGTYTKLTVNAKGIITAGAALSSGDVTGALGFTPMASTGTAAAATIAATAGALSASRIFAASGDATGSVSSDLSNGYTMALTLASVAMAGTYNSVVTDAKGRVVSGSVVPYIQNVVLQTFGATPGLTITAGPFSAMGTVIAVALDAPGPAVATYNFSTIQVDANGRVVTGANGSPVTSVALSLPSLFSVSGGPVTGVGTLAAILASQSANLVFAGPTTGSAAPSFRSLVAGDLPTVGTAGTFTNSNIVIDQYGRVTSASNGSAGGGATFTPGTYGLANIVVDGSGAISTIASTTVSNLGTANPIAVSSAGTLAFKTLKAGTNITIGTTANEVTINATAGGIAVYLFRINFTGITSTPVNTSSPITGVPSGWTVTAQTTTSVSFSVPSGTFGSTYPSAVVIYGGFLTSGAYTMRPANSSAANNCAAVITDTTFVISNITSTSSGVTNSSDPHMIVRILV